MKLIPIVLLFLPATVMADKPTATETTAKAEIDKIYAHARKTGQLPADYYTRLSTLLSSGKINMQEYIAEVQSLTQNPTARCQKPPH